MHWLNYFYLIISLFLLFKAAAVLVFGTVIVPLKAIYASLLSHKLDLKLKL